MHTYYVLLCSDEWVGMLICDDQLFHNLRILPPSCLVCFLWILVLFSTLKKGYHTVVVDPFNSEGYNNLVARKLKGYIALWLES